MESRLTNLMFIFFSFNNPYGACPECEGYGKVIGIDEDLVIPNKIYPFLKTLSLVGEVKP